VLPRSAAPLPDISVSRTGDDVLFSYVNILHLRRVEVPGSQTLHFRISKIKNSPRADMCLIICQRALK
jgi:hypothetical protein